MKTVSGDRVGTLLVALQEQGFDDISFIRAFPVKSSVSLILAARL